MNEASRVYVAGHRGMAGSAIHRRLIAEGFSSIIARTRDEVDLTVARQVDELFASERPEYVFLAAARVGGIMANNNYPADFIRDNLAIELNVIDAARRYGVTKLLFLGSSCVYPRLAPQPIREEYLLTGELERTNEAYAIAKIAGLKLCEFYHQQYGSNFISVMPTNLYGPGDNYDLETSHVLAAMIRRFHDAVRDLDTTVTLWGTGAPLREFLHADDLADACVFLMRNYNDASPVNVGWGREITIRGLAELVAETAGFSGSIVWDTTRPDGTPRKLLDTSKLAALGWAPSISLKEGIRRTLAEYGSLDT